MDHDYRKLLKEAIDQETRIRLENGRYDCDPESLTNKALEFDEIGRPDLGDAIRRFRDLVVNKLFAEGWSLERIERAMVNWHENERKRSA